MSNLLIDSICPSQQSIKAAKLEVCELASYRLVFAHKVTILVVI